MTIAVLPNGSQIASHLHDSSESVVSVAQPPRTLADLFATWAQSPPPQEAMLRTTCSRLSDYLEEPVETISLDAVNRQRKGFRRFLESRKFSENSVRGYVNYALVPGQTHLKMDEPLKVL